MQIVNVQYRCFLPEENNKGILIVPDCKYLGHGKTLITNPHVREN